MFRRRCVVEEEEVAAVVDTTSNRREKEKGMEVLRRRYADVSRMKKEMFVGCASLVKKTKAR